MATAETETEAAAVAAAGAAEAEAAATGGGTRAKEASPGTAADSCPSSCPRGRRSSADPEDRSTEEGAELVYVLVLHIARRSSHITRPSPFANVDGGLK